MGLLLCFSVFLWVTVGGSGFKYQGEDETKTFSSLTYLSGNTASLWRGSGNSTVALKVISVSESYLLQDTYVFYLPHSVSMSCECGCSPCNERHNHGHCPTCFNVTRPIFGTDGNHCAHDGARGGKRHHSVTPRWICCRAQVAPGTSKYRASHLAKSPTLIYKFSLLLNGTQSSTLILSSDPANELISRSSPHLVYSDDHLKIHLALSRCQAARMHPSPHHLSSTFSYVHGKQGRLFQVSPRWLNDPVEWDPRKLGWIREWNGTYLMTSPLLLRDVTSLEASSCKNPHPARGAFTGLLRRRALSLLHPVKDIGLIGSSDSWQHHIFIPLANQDDIGVELQISSQGETFVQQIAENPNLDSQHALANLTLWREGTKGSPIWLTGGLITNSTSKSPIVLSVSIKYGSLK